MSDLKPVIYFLFPTVLIEIKNQNINFVVDNPPLIGYNTLVTWFERIVKFDFVQIMALVRVIRSDFSFKGRSPAFFRFKIT